ncbi:MAG: LPP20 family lipoprotein [Salinivirgaceae bacterium]|nr:LPP20 family lipoprotein [Salinivirgaceae bacterium]
MIQKTSFLIIIVALLFACGTTKNVTQTVPLPDWVKSKPVSTIYYIGIGSAVKTANISDYQSGAKNSALADMTSEISVNISTSSVLHKFESSLGYSEDFSAATKASASEDLEGYELVNSFESDTHYYVYYRLSKIKYTEIKEQRKVDAIAKGLDFYNKALSFRERNQYFEAISNYIKGLECIKAYFTESLETNYNGTNIYLGNELFSGFVSTVNSIKIIPKKESLSVKKGQSLSSSDLLFTVKNTDGQSLSGIPILFNLGTLPLRNSQVKSDANGLVFYQINEVKTKANQTYFVASVDMNTLATGVTFDPLFRKMIRKFDAPKGQIHIRINNPSFYVHSTELNFGEALMPKIIEPKVQQILASKGYPVITKKEAADYVIELEINTLEDKQQGKMYYASLSGNIKIFNKQNELLALKPIDKINGVKLSFNDAGFDAYINLSDYLDRNLMIKLKKAIE